MSYKDLTESTFKETIKNGIVVVDFYATNCNPCKVMGKYIAQLAVDVGDKAVVAKLNTDENPDVAEEYGIFSVPTIVFFKNGKEVNRLVGLQSYKDLTIAVNRILTP